MDITKEAFADLFDTNVAPDIIGNDTAKKLITLQLLTNPLEDEKFHIMLIGVPASGKSVIIKEVSDIRPKANYMASNITRVGLREKAGESDGSLISIDEMDKLSSETLNGLLELMQFGRISVDIHNQHYSIKAKVNVLCACNPKYKVWLMGMNIFDQIPFKKDLLTRFHVIIPFYKVDPNYYPEIASKMCINNNNEERIKNMKSLIVKILSKYNKITIPKDIGRMIGEYVSELEQLSIYREVISPRTIEGMISCVKARARLRLSKDNKANEEDFFYVRDLFNKLHKG